MTVRGILTQLFFALALIGAGFATYYVLQPNPRGDYLTGMVHLFIAMMGAGAALFAAIVAALLQFTQLKTWWIMLGAAIAAGLTAVILLMI